jgi:hypothetical protein
MVWLITEGGRLARAENRRVTRVYDQRDGLPKYPLNLMTAARASLADFGLPRDLSRPLIPPSFCSCLF